MFAAIGAQLAAPGKHQHCSGDDRYRRKEQYAALHAVACGREAAPRILFVLSSRRAGVIGYIRSIVSASLTALVRYGRTIRVARVLGARGQRSVGRFPVVGTGKLIEVCSAAVGCHLVAL